MPPKFLQQLGLSTATSALGAMNTGIDYLFKQNEREQEKQWWYEQQQYLEEHNSPAYRSMQMRKAGLNPYTEVGSVPLGNVDSSLPRMSSTDTFDIHSIQNSLLLTAQRDNIEQDTDTKASQAGMYDSTANLNNEKVKTETEWRSNIIQQTLNLKQDYDLGLINKETMELKFKELKDAYEQGYNHYVQEMKKNEAEIGVLESEATSIADSNKRANALHDYAIKLSQADLNAKEFTNAMLADEAVFTMNKSNMRTYLNVNYDDLPTWLKPYALTLYNTYELIQSADPSTNGYDEVNNALNAAKSEFGDLVQKFISDSSFNNSIRDVSSFESALSVLATVSVQDAKWTREAQQRMFDNTMKAIQGASTIISTNSK